MIEYKIIERRNPIDPLAPPKFYAHVVKSGNVNIDKIARDISKMTTVTPVDTAAVIAAFIFLLPDYFSEGKSVELDGFGRFSISSKSIGEETADDVTSSTIKGLRLNYTPARKIKDVLKVAVFKKRQ